MANNMKCNITLPCGHECSYTNQTPHWKHKRSKCNKICGKELCPRGHKCEKLCGEACGPCKYPVQAELPCRHKAILPCCAVDKYQCQEQCVKVICSQGHTCGKECWEDCGSCKIPIPLKLPCSHHAIVPCYLNDGSYKCKVKCGKKLNCPFQHECEKECWERCFPCTNRVIRTLSCGHEVNLPCHMEFEKYKCQKQCGKVLCINNHICRKPCWEECGPCRSKIGVTLPCSHKMVLPCGTDLQNHICKHICDKILCNLGHRCKNLCWESCSKCPCSIKLKGQSLNCS